MKMIPGHCSPIPLEVLKGISSGSLRKEWEDRWRASGKEPPKSVERFNKDQVEKSAKKLSSEIQAAFTQSNMKNESIRATLTAKVDELEAWMKRGDAMGAETVKPTTIEWMRNRIEQHAKLAQQG